MGCGCVSQHQSALSGAGPRLFLSNVTDVEFVRSLDADEQKDKKRLLAYFHLVREGQFEVTAQLLDLVRRRGVPTRFRWAVWRKVSEWPNLYKRGAYEKIVQCEPNPKVVDAIEKDLDRTFPGVEEFDDVKKHQLATILLAYAAVFPKVGYCQGMNFVGGFLLLASGGSAEDAFFMFVQIMVKYRGNLLFCDHLPMLKLLTFQFRMLLETFFPDVHRHFEENIITPELYATKWLLTIFTQPLPFPVAARVWDLIVCDGLDAMVTLALANIKLMRASLLRQSTEGLLELLSLRGDDGPTSGDPIINAAIRLKQTGPQRVDISLRLGQLKSIWVGEYPEDASKLKKADQELCKEWEDVVLEPPDVSASISFASAHGETEDLAKESALGAPISTDVIQEVDVEKLANSSGTAHAEAADEVRSSEDMGIMFSACSPTPVPPPVGEIGGGAAASMPADPCTSTASSPFLVFAEHRTPASASASPFAVAAEAKVELKQSMPSRRAGSKCMYGSASPAASRRGSDPASLSGSGGDAATACSPVMEHLPRLASAGRRRPSAAGSTAAAFTAGEASRSTPVSASPSLPSAGVVELPTVQQDNMVDAASAAAPNGASVESGVHEDVPPVPPPFPLLRAVSEPEAVPPPFTLSELASGSVAGRAVRGSLTARAPLDASTTSAVRACPRLPPTTRVRGGETERDANGDRVLRHAPLPPHVSSQVRPSRARSLSPMGTRSSSPPNVSLFGAGTALAADHWGDVRLASTLAPVTHLPRPVQAAPESHFGPIAPPRTVEKQRRSTNQNRAKPLSAVSHPTPAAAASSSGGAASASVDVPSVAAANVSHGKRTLDDGSADGHAPLGALPFSDAPAAELEAPQEGWGKPCSAWGSPRPAAASDSGGAGAERAAVAPRTLPPMEGSAPGTDLDRDELDGGYLQRQGDASAPDLRRPSALVQGVMAKPPATPPSRTQVSRRKPLKKSGSDPKAKKC